MTSVDSSLHHSEKGLSRPPCFSDDSFSGDDSSVPEVPMLGAVAADSGPFSEFSISHHSPIGIGSSGRHPPFRRLTRTVLSSVGFSRPSQGRRLLFHSGIRSSGRSHLFLHHPFFTVRSPGRRLNSSVGSQALLRFYQIPFSRVC